MRSIRLGRRGLISVLSVAGLILVLVFVVVPMVGRGILRDKLQVLISEQLNATLEMGGLAYLPPYGARVTDARLTAKDAAGQSVELFSAKSIVLKLAELPIGSGPLVIKALTIDTPSVRLVRETGGIVGRGSPITAIATTQPTEESKQKLSEIFELRKVELTEGSFVYEDRTDPASLPLAWRGLTLDLNTEPKTAAEYAFKFDATNGNVGKFAANGTFNIDELLLRLAHSRVEAQVDSSAEESALPSEVQRMLKLYEISGAVSVDSSGEMPLMRPTEGRVTSVIELKNAKGKLPGASAPLDNVSLKITCSAEPMPRPGAGAAAHVKPVLATTSGQTPATHDGLAPTELPLMRAQIEHLEARGAGASVSASGIMNADDTMLRVEQLKVHAVLDAQAKASALPEEILAQLQKHALGGEAIVELAGEAPIHDYQRGRLTSSTIELKNATARLPNAGASLEEVSLKMQCAAEPVSEPSYVAGYPVPKINANIERIQAGGPGATVSGIVAFNTDERMLRVEDCRLDATIDPTVERNALPAEVIARLMEHALSGKATIQLAGEAPLSKLEQARGTSTITLAGATGRLPEAAGVLDDVSITMHCAVEPAEKPTIVHGFAVPRVKANIEHLTARGSGADVSLSAKFATDDTMLRVEQCRLDADVDPVASDNALPPAVLKRLAEYSAAGKATVSLAGEAPLAQPRRARLTSTVVLSDARGVVPGANGALDDIDLKLDVAVTPSTQPSAEIEPLPQLVKLTFDHLHAAGSGSTLDITGGTIVLNGQNRACGITDLKLAARLADDRSVLPATLVEALKPYGVAGKLLVTLNGSGPIPESMQAIRQAQADVVISNEGLELRLPDFPEPVHKLADITGTLADGVLTFNTIRAYYGEDFVFVREAEVPLDSLPDRLDVRRFEGAVTFSPNVPKYRKDLADIMTLARPRDRFEFEGSADLDLTDASVPVHRYDVKILSSEGSAISALGGRVPLLNLTTEIVITPEVIQLNRFEANTLSGTVFVAGRMVPDDAMTYRGEVRLRQIDLNTAASLLAEPGEDPLVVSGELSADVKFSGAGVDESALDNLRTIEPALLEISRGDLYKIPVLRQIVERIKLSNAATVGDTQAQVSVADGVITLHAGVVAAPALGVKGHGTITFDQELKLAGVANPLGSWTKKANIGLIGATEELINKGSSLLYEVEVRGTIEKPEVRITGGEKLIDSDSKKGSR